MENLILIFVSILVLAGIWDQVTSLTNTIITAISSIGVM
ncbi:hypothetical protein [Vibrio phage phiKT1028]|nr:hypothetical protein [Vibrio phage phiKT1028]